MRTKTLICAAALAAGALTSWAQSNVYSLNVVGYVNVQIKAPNANLIGNPLNNTAVGGNNITNLFKQPAIADGATIFRYNPSAAKNDVDDVTFWTFFAGIGWQNSSTSDLNGFVLGAGEAISLTANTASDSTNTFVGDVDQGLVTSVPVLKDSGRWLISRIPIVNTATNAVQNGFPLADGDTLFFWDNAAGDYDGIAGPSHPNAQPVTWVAGPNVWSPSVPAHTLQIGEGFQLNGGGSATGDRVWTRNFTVQ